MRGGFIALLAYEELQFVFDVPATSAPDYVVTGLIPLKDSRTMRTFDPEDRDGATVSPCPPAFQIAFGEVSR